MSHKTSVFCTLQFSAVHKCPADVCPDSKTYLTNRHRHLFHVRCEADVTHDNRDIEFLCMKDEIDTYCRLRFAKETLGEMSCEQIAAELLNAHSFLTVVEVSEDGENGAIVRRDNVRAE